MATEKGKLVRWIDDRGFGFIKPENGKDDIFIHISALRGRDRKPVIGDVIYYEISFDKGKTRAVNARIERASPTLTLAPIERKYKTGFSSPSKISYRKSSDIGKPNKSFNLFPIITVIGVAIFIYTQTSKEKTFFDPVKIPVVSPDPIEQAQQFQCQGKVWCSEMSSYEEAVFYLRNCPGTKMDGDGDGIPCERQF